MPKPRKSNIKGAVRQLPSGRWQVVITLPLNDDGKRPQLVRTFDTEIEANDFRLRQADPRRRPTVEHGMTVEALLDRWLDHQHDRIAATTHQTYRLYATNRIIPTLGDTPLHRLSVADVDDLYTLLRKQGLAATSIRQVHAILRGALAWGRKRGYVDINVAADAAPPSVKKKRITPPTPPEIQKLLAAAAELDPWFGCACRLAAATGARRGTVASFRLSDFRFATGEVLVDRSLAMVGKQRIVKGLKADNGGWVPVGARTLEIVTEHVASLHERARACGITLAEDFYLFATDVGCTVPIAPYSLTNRWRKMVVRVGLPNVRFHDLRHYVATELLAGGYDGAVIADRLRWESSAMLEVYGHARQDRARQASEHIERSLG